ncbi:SURF1 family protein [Kaistia dalseonensis]|uniref:SURF1-like protein n=1 Tax=Kaistia dalseonensis TaxID=410840 RepID=A0ABU0HBG7_9HYPH|nr:SURF1 family protein [Kaistia dalseonensis]MCX5496498.1 SURF1 family protein [Kaistia dalseonensis]MDQ0439120.1 surfeit locus 1 family protein [Kaistia dalseonensis]
MSLAILGVLAVAAIAGLMALGVWQIERRAWKLDLIARVEQRIEAAPVAAPGPSVWPTINADSDDYRRVRASGHFLNNLETLTQAATSFGSGYWVLTPFRTDDGFTVLVNRGFVLPAERDPTARSGTTPEGETVVTGLLRMSEPKGGFLRSNDPAADRWYSRDVAAIAAARGLPVVAPYFIDADPSSGPDAVPRGGLTVISFPNNHLVYALTWFALALMLAGGLAYVVREELRLRRPRIRHDSRRAS